MDGRARWIWADAAQEWDQYAEFIDEFDWNGEELTLQISADSNYAAYCNGRPVYSGQYADFPYDKVYDEIDLRPFAQRGANRLAVVVWYYGMGNMGYYPAQGALCYAVHRGGELACASGENTLSRLSPAYTQGLRKVITGQLGYSFRYDLTKEDGFPAQDAPSFAPSRLIDKPACARIRPQKRCVIGEAAPARCISSEEDRHFLFDLGQESVGYLCVEIDSDAEQELLIAYGEHLADGGVRRLVGGRDFSVQLRLRKGRNAYVNPFRRLGLRYIEVFCEAPVRIEKMTVLPVEYPVREAGGRPEMNDMQKRIYDVCLRTLRLCMHEHYEDTPWREQALYAMDSRNQMLCGYYAFREFEFARANLLLMSKDERADGLLSICTPSANDLTIPSFSLHYFTEVWEYTHFSGDLTLAREVFPKLGRIMQAFVSRLSGGLVPIFEGKTHWNFYEWSEGLSGALNAAEEGGRFDAALNCLLSLALRMMGSIARAIGEADVYSALAGEVACAVRARFYDENTGLFVNSTADETPSELVNALAVLCGAAQGEEALRIARRLAQEDNGLTGATLSMLCFKYDALLLADRERYRPYILEDIARRYGKMLDAGATTFWETEKGEADFDDAGSLCHGWSAMPVYYYHTLPEGK
ncbi:MAG: family 78 glycoside hydrolase catalytic domain [Eubacteriales bacterium]|nr:family 78 glycoside hydrolase catalytic domain [Eubacteriales bacterium]